MTKHEIIRTVDAIKKGTFVRIVYRTELPLCAAAKKSGHVIIKETEKVVRIGVDYKNIARVKEAESARTAPKRERSAWCHWEIPHVLAKHNNRDDYYLSVATVEGNGHHTKNSYFIDGTQVTRSDVENSNYVLPSYFNQSGEYATVQNINITNIIKLGGHRA